MNATYSGPTTRRAAIEDAGDFRRNIYLHTLGLAAAAALTFGAGAARGDGISVPNFSFESQTTAFADPRVDSWQKTDQPVWYDPVAFGYTWDQTVGAFANTPVGNGSHIDNLEGNQAIWMFAIPQVGIFQDNNSTDWTGSASHAFNSVFQVGQAYNLTVGVLPGSSLVLGSGLQLSLYYRDGLNNPVTVGSTYVTYDAQTFPNSTHLIDCSVNVPTVQAGDAWAGKNIGIEMMSASMGNSYWDVDNVRLAAVPEPGSLALLALGGAACVAARLRRRS